MLVSTNEDSLSLVFLVREYLEEERLGFCFMRYGVDRESNTSVHAASRRGCQVRIRTMRLVIPPPLTSWSPIWTSR